MYAAEMGISLFSDIDRYALEDAIVTLSYHLQVAGGSYEEVSMGLFEISEANRKAKCLEIKAYGRIDFDGNASSHLDRGWLCRCNLHL